MSWIGIPDSGCRQLGAISASGTSTNARSCALGWGNIGGGSPRLTAPRKSIRSRSKVRAAFAAPRWRSNWRSSRIRSSKKETGSRAVSTLATPLTNHGCSDGGTGALRYQEDCLTTRCPDSQSALTAKFKVCIGDPNDEGRLAPNATMTKSPSVFLQTIQVSLAPVNKSH